MEVFICLLGPCAIRGSLYGFPLGIAIPQLTLEANASWLPNFISPRSLVLYESGHMRLYTSNPIMAL